VLVCIIIYMSMYKMLDLGFYVNHPAIISSSTAQQLTWIFYCVNYTFNILTKTILTAVYNPRFQIMRNCTTKLSVLSITLVIWLLILFVSSHGVYNSHIILWLSTLLVRQMFYSSTIVPWKNSYQIPWWSDSHRQWWLKSHSITFGAWQRDSNRGT
jgi:hypothetical protein